MKTKLKLFGGFIVLPVKVIGSNGLETELLLAVDTGANRTILQTFSAKLIGNVTTVCKSTLTSGSKQKERVRETKLKALYIDGFELKNFDVIVKTLPKNISYIHGLLGYDFFQELNLKLLFDFENNILSIT